MAAPTFVAAYGPTTVATGTPKSVSVTMATGDILVALAVSGNGGNVISITAAAGQTWTLQQSQTVSTSAGGWCWTATANTSQTATFTLAASSSSNGWDFQVLRFSGGTVGTSAKQAATTSVAASVTFTTGGDNSAIAMMVGDFNAGAITGATYNTATAGTFTQLVANAGGNVTGYLGYYANAGTAGSKTVGMTAPTMQPTTIAVEIMGPAAYVANPTDISGLVDQLPYLPPDTVTATAVSATQIDLAWGMVPDAYAYDIERNGAVIASSVTGTTYSDTGLTAGTSYTYNVRSLYI